ncbi:MAG: DUF4097 family beta strand repeat-containing protein [Spirochaetaceae bacterium]|nr:DUF4097 family beta strand repeat-containing protein [Spirochaetaceae bacterium]
MMRRDDYLAALAAELDALSPEDRDEILKEMSSHIEELAERRPGASEEEMVASLTRPEILARGLLEEFAFTASASGSSDAGGKANRPAGEKRRSSWKGGMAEEEARDLGRAVRDFAGGPDRKRGRWKGCLEAGPRNLVLSFPAADIVIESGRAESFEAEAEILGPSGELGSWAPMIELVEESLRMGEATDEVRVARLRVRVPESLRSVSVNSRGGDILSRAGGIAIEASTKSGDIELHGARMARAETRSGDIAAERCGRIEASSMSGDIRLSEIESDVRADTASGDIAVESSAGPVRAKSASGDLRLVAIRGFRGGELASASGDVTAKVECESIELRGESLSGDLSFGDRSVGEGTPRRLVAKLRGGGPVLAMTSVSGDVTAEL